MASRTLAFLLVFFLLKLSLCSQPFQKILFTDNQAARCLDGSPTGIYYQDKRSENYLIYFQGGGACAGTTNDQIIADCYERSKSQLGSSIDWPTEAELEGIFSDDDKINPYFSPWNKAYIPYCDGTLHQGTIRNPVEYQGKQLQFRGHNNTEESFKQIIDVLGAAKAKKVVLSGASAGGLATFYWANALRDLLTPETKMWSMPDSGFFLHKEKPQKSGDLRNPNNMPIQNLVNKEISHPNSFCNTVYPKEAYKCFYPQYSAILSRVPTFIINSEQDSYTIQYILNMTCFNGISFSSCNQTEMEMINLFRDTAVSQVKTVLRQRPDFGAWMPACAAHVICENNSLFNSNRWAVPMNSSYTLQASISKWINSEMNGVQSYNDWFIDDVYWPNNKQCS